MRTSRFEAERGWVRRRMRGCLVGGDGGGVDIVMLLGVLWDVDV